MKESNLNFEHGEEAFNETMVFEGLDNDYTLWKSLVIVFVWVAIETLGNGFLLALMHFYWFGGDPLKWRIVDHVSNETCLTNK